MKISMKLMVMVGVPIAAIVAILAVGLVSFSNIRTLATDINLNQNDRATMIDGDRDAYQAQLAEIFAPRATTEAEVIAQRDAYAENAQQTWDRIVVPGERFGDAMAADLAVFKTEYQSWRDGGEAVIELAQNTVTGNAERQIAAAAAITSFGEMRDVIDQLGVMIDTMLGQTLTAQRRRDLETALSLVLNADRDAYQAYVAQLEILGATTVETLDEWTASNTENTAQTLERVSSGALIVGSAAAGLNDQFTTSFGEWEQYGSRIVELSRQNFADNVAVSQMSAQTLVHFEAMRAAINDMGELQKADVEEHVVEMSATIASTTTLYLIIALAAIVLAVAIGFVVAMRITRSLGKAVRLADQVSLGDLTSDLDIKQKDEIGQLADALRKMVEEIKRKSAVLEAIASGDLTTVFEKASEVDALGQSLVTMNESLNSLFGQINTAVDQVASGSDQVAQASQSLSQGATEQASSLEEITSSLTEISGQSRQNVEYAEQGNSQMKGLVTAMGAINESSDEIRKVVKVIDDIAFQINLLALNANVEAARAGKYGKGFAVVAEEVRNLAVRSADAVKETTQMVDETVKNIEIGNELAAATATQLEEMSVASKEQAQGVEQINSGLEQIDQVTQSNTASAEESASAAEELASQAQQLKAVVSRFKLSAEGDEVSGRPVAYSEIMSNARANDTERLAGSSGFSSDGREPVLAGVPGNGSRNVRPQDVIKLDDEDFGEF
jgi:methyl-accepting chemotaxis protein